MVVYAPSSECEAKFDLINFVSQKRKVQLKLIIIVKLQGSLQGVCQISNTGFPDFTLTFF